MELTNVSIMIIQCLHTFLGGDLQVVHRDLLKLAYRQNLPVKKPQSFAYLLSKFKTECILKVEF